MMGSFGSISLGEKFGIILGCLIAVVFSAGLVKLFINKRRLKRNQKIADIEEAGKKTVREKLVNRKVDPGDLFGVRAIEAGYFGGISQSRPNSPAPSYKLSPSTTLVDWSKTERAGSPSGQSNASVTSLPVIPDPAKKKPSPLRLAPFDADMKNGSGATGAYLSPLPSPRSIKSATNATGGWVSPLDVHFSRPTTPNASEKSRPTSYLPRLQFPEEIGKNGLLVSTPAGSIQEKTETVSIIGREASPAPTLKQDAAAEPNQRLDQPETFTFPQTSHSPATHQQRPIFPADYDADRPSSHRGNKSFKNIPIPPVPKSPSYFPKSPNSPVFDPAVLSDSHRWNSDRAVIRESVVSKRSVSVYRPKSTRGQSPDTAHTYNRAHSGAPSSVYSTRTSILDEDKTSRQHARKRSQSSEALRSRSRSTSHKRSSSSGKLARTQNSVRRHSRKTSQEPLKFNKRHSRERDQIHYDPRQSRRDRSGSVQGRAVDFDHPRESPFSNANAIRNHSNSSSTSSSSSFGTPDQQQVQGPDPKPVLDLTLPEPERFDRLSVLPSHGRHRTASEVSQGSIGEFYDAYYRQSILAQRASIAAQVPGIRKPAPLNPNFGGGALAGGAIMEMPSPTPSPMFPKTAERFPGMI